MDNLDESLNGLRLLARDNPDVRQSLLATRNSDYPLAEFCRLSTRYGFPIYEMDLISAGETYNEEKRRHEDDGRVHSPLLEGEDDYYEPFLDTL